MDFTNGVRLGGIVSLYRTLIAQSRLGGSYQRSAFTILFASLIASANSQNVNV
jgi:hypothetical protein